MRFKDFFKGDRKRPDAEALRYFVNAENPAGSGRQGQDCSGSRGSADYQKLQAIWDALESYPAELDPGIDLAPVTVGRSPSGWRRRTPLLAAAASIVMVVSVVLLLFREPAADYYQTARGEQQRIELADGSVVQLNSLSRIAVAYSSKVRQIKVERGEALFDVAENPDRKFIVGTDKGAVEAIGTRFNVNLFRDALIVTVEEGEILVSNGKERLAEQAAEIAVAGQQIAVDAGGKITNKKLDSLLPALAWIDHKIIFTGETLEQAVEQVNRYNKQRITILDARLRELPIYGVFNTGDYQGFLSALEKSYELKAVDGTVDQIYLVYRAHR